MGETPKTPDELAEKELNKKQAKSIANRLWEIKKLEAQKKKLEKQIEKIKSGEFVPDEGSLSTKDEDDESSSLHVVLLLDESGSMNSCKDQTIRGFNEYLQTLKQEKKKIKMSFTRFSNDNVRIEYTNMPVGNASQLTTETYQPNGNTPLFDAIGKTIQNNKENGRTLFVIMTDGEENSSKEYKKDAIVSFIKERETKGWTFVYLGANQDAWANSQSLGLHAGNVMSYDSSNTYHTMCSLTANTMNFCNSKNRTTTNFWDSK